MEGRSKCKVCVTGGAGYIGSALVHSLLQNGYTVHATLRNLGDESKVGLLSGFPYAKERLHLFEADIYKPQEFEEAIQGCLYVFHLATPIYDTSGYKYNDKIEGTISAVKKISDICIQTKTVRRLIYTASVVATSPLKDDGSGYKTTMDESCWTPLHISVPYDNEFAKEYTETKTRAQQKILKIGKDKANALEVVTLSCGLVGRGGHIPYSTGSVTSLISQVTNNETHYKLLKKRHWLMEDFYARVRTLQVRKWPSIIRKTTHNFTLTKSTWKDQSEKSNGVQQSLKIKGFLTNTIPRRYWMIVSNMQRDGAIYSKNMLIIL